MTQLKICPNCQAAHGQVFPGDVARLFCPNCGHRWKPPQVVIVGPRANETAQGRAARERVNEMWIDRVETIYASTFKAPQPQIGGAA